MEARPGIDPARRAELEARFLSSLPLIEQTIRFVARRNRLSTAEQDDFSSEVKLALIDHDYEVMARFQGRSAIRTYLVTVIQRLFLDYRRRLWGKWHPSAEAARLGPLALRLEILVYRDGLSLSEACETLRTNHGAAETIESLIELAGRLPNRQRVRLQALGDADPAADSDSAAPEAVNPDVALQGRQTVERCQQTIERTLAGWPPDDRIVLRLRFEDDVSVADIARTLCLDQKKLYRRIDALLGDLRQALDSAGLGWDEVRQMMERGQCHLRLPREGPALGTEKGPARPSTLEATS